MDAISLKRLFLSLLLGTGLTLGLLSLLNPVSPATRAASFTVCLAGPPTCDYVTIQAAVDAASSGDVIKVSTGVYTGVNDYGGLAQIVYLSKSVTIRGGYTDDFTDPPDPEANPAILDAQGLGRVIFIISDISPTIEGLRITGGDATELGGSSFVRDDSGGGVCIITATATISGNRIVSNTASLLGGGVWLYRSDANVRNNTIAHNTAKIGGGMALYYSDASLISNRIISNSALYYEAPTPITHGGGVYLHKSNALLESNTIGENDSAYGGGGVYLFGERAVFSRNEIIANTAVYAGGLELFDSEPVVFNGDIISANIATEGAGGIVLAYSDSCFINTIITDNCVGTGVSGISVYGSSPQFLHSTIARNHGGDGIGLFLRDLDLSPVLGGGIRYSRAALTNTILVSHTVGLSVTKGNTATLEATLWGTASWANIVDWTGAGTIVTGTDNYWEDPAFIDPDNGDYHLGFSSQAIDKGVETGITGDIDGDVRPQGAGFDLGADEVVALLVYLPVIFKQ